MPDITNNTLRKTSSTNKLKGITPQQWFLESNKKELDIFRIKF